MNYRTSLYILVSEKFENFFEEIEYQMKNLSFKECKENLEILKKYKNSDVNTLLKNEIKKNYD